MMETVMMGTVFQTHANNALRLLCVENNLRLFPAFISKIRCMYFISDSCSTSMIKHRGFIEIKFLALKTLINVTGTLAFVKPNVS